MLVVLLRSLGPGVVWLPLFGCFNGSEVSCILGKGPECYVNFFFVRTETIREWIAMVLVPEMYNSHRQRLHLNTS
jgi:hypothetical protein